ncbi:MAG: rhodanese-like domain-containing protein [Streptococcus sp.]|uniref:rhodanese-like domain-containing protein n=1 Tax=Streptococcus sp. TaxID=1306 RepID=UPI000459208B|nr:rhodanese-like domain-containing protein [Streptococcus sp.]AHZ48194.1 rhodanese [Streptococcus sp. VT 162]MDU5072950.1 rhodanese-like domain-containing protein [Streptococcus sp.]
MKEITFNDFYQLYQKESLSVIDVREVEEFETLHLEGAQNLPLSQLADTYDQLDKDLLYYVICKSGMRSARACQFLAEQGYDVINVQGGVTAFENL